MKKALSKCDIPLLVLTIVMSIFGLIMVFSASSVSSVLRYSVAPSYFFIKQLIFLAIGYLGGIVVLNIHTSKYFKLRKALVLFMIVLLVGVFFGGIAVNGTLGWYDLGFFTFQPSETAKVVLIIYLASSFNYLNNKYPKFNNKYLIPLGIGVIFGGLVLMQPDLGTAAIIFAMTFLIFLSLPVVKKDSAKIYKVLFIGLLILVACCLLFGKAIFTESRMSRFTFTNPCDRYREVTGYQVCNGFIAIHNGGLFGVGLGNSTQKYLYLPESHTDSIFPIIVEECGLIVGILVILVYAIMLWRILLIAKSANNLRGSLIAYGTFIYMLLHIIINLGGILALIPFTGVPLPLLSYGGNYTIFLVIALFLCQRVSIESKTAKTKAEIKNI